MSAEEDVAADVKQESENSGNCREKELEKRFSYRFTDEDEEFKSYLDRASKPPPVIFPWYNKPRRNFDYTKRSDGNSERFHKGQGNRYHPYRSNWNDRRGEGYEQRSEYHRERYGHQHGSGSRNDGNRYSRKTNY